MQNEYSHYTLEQAITKRAQLEGIKLQLENELRKQNREADMARLKSLDPKERYAGTNAVQYEDRARQTSAQISSLIRQISQLDIIINRSR